MVLLALLLTPHAIDPTTITTGPGQTEPVKLKDGSGLFVGADTKVIIHDEVHERRIELPYGQVISTVQHDSTRPFYVHTPLATVRAVGTKFAVDHRDGRTEVTTSDGQVLIQRNTHWGFGLSESAQAARDQQVIVKPGEPMIPRAIDADAWLAWERGLVVVRQASVQSAIARFNRHSAFALKVPRDSEIPLITVTGTFDVHRPDLLERFLDEQLRKRKELKSQAQKQPKSIPRTDP
ncbi:FecR family protein [Steroidobacter sp.]|uniref:FecR family protein n=1 Tax=Steroidobacter sp. TaxID=1978227 RepID=UPI001A4C5654|nr:FecR domain-containing protein [Steroidobacter sp.]MBL8268041.1 FecR domain-containing protein [Steroidobacter sp.]